MIRVTRGPKPPVLAAKEQEWLQALLAATQVRARTQAIRRYNHPGVRSALTAAFHGKCAYCESKVAHVSYPHIEHFRPKSSARYRQLAFAWDNLLLACGVCNSGAHKGDRFPEASEGGPLIDPCAEEPSDHLEFRYDALAALASVYGKTPRGRMTEELLGLNREALRTQRSIQVRRLAFIALRARHDARARALLDEAMREDAEYAAFARALTTTAHAKHQRDNTLNLPVAGQPRA